MTTIALRMKPVGALHPRRLRPYLYLFALGYRTTMRNRGAAIGRVIFLAVLLTVFSSLWRVLADEQGSLGISAGDIVWYLALTEWVQLALPHMHMEMEGDMRSGDFACQQPRPVSYLWSRVAEHYGVMLARMTLLLIFGAPVAWLLAGGFPSAPLGMLWACLLAPASAFGMLVGMAWIGISCAWLHEAESVYWLWQKLGFLLGGLLVPLTLYPLWVQEIAWFTPFASMTFGLGRQALGVGPETALVTLVHVLAWTLGLALFAQLLFRRALATMSVNGG